MQRLRAHAVDAQGGILFDQLDNRLFNSAPTPPTNSLPGYQPGAYYMNTAGSIGSLVFLNIGTLVSSNWFNLA